MTKTLAFLLDPLEQLQIASDTTIAFMEAALKRGYQVATFTSAQLFYINSEVKATVDYLDINLDQKPWWHIKATKTINLKTCDAIIIRKDPPFDQEYLYVTYLFELLELQGVVVSNSAIGIRDANEKLFTTQFAHLMTETLVSNQIELINNFLNHHQRIVIKPLNSMAGRDVVLLDHQQPGIKALITLLTHDGQQKVMAQRFLPTVMQGDKRIHMINGEPMPYGLLRKPAQGDFRANLAAGGSGTAFELTEKDKALCEELKPILISKKLDFVGIDIIDDHLTEINVTCPTGVRALFNLTGFDISEKWLNMIDERLKNR